MGIAILDATGLIRGRLLSISFYNKGGKNGLWFLELRSAGRCFLSVEVSHALAEACSRRSNSKTGPQKQRGV